MSLSLRNNRLCTSSIEQRPYQQVQSPLPSIKLPIPLHQIPEQIELYQWRKVHRNYLIHFQWTSIQPLSPRQVEIHLCPSQTLQSLQEISEVKGTHVLCSLSKVFTGFKVLFDRFGAFEVDGSLIGFNSSFEPFVWMNASYGSNELISRTMSEEQLTASVVRALLKAKQKFGVVGFQQACERVLSACYNLDEAALYFLDCHQKIVNKENSGILLRSKEPPGFLTFNKEKNRKKCRKGSACDKQSFSTSFDAKTLKKSTKIDSISTDSTLPPHSAIHHCALRNSPPADTSFSFEEESGLEAVGICKLRGQLFVSVCLQSQQSQGEERDAVVLPMLDQYSAKVVQSIIQSS